jgi:2-polyprenyl-3-methyl-5-hydroxy-6-metoxy-1,4-benzoquinol methylase
MTRLERSSRRAPPFITGSVRSCAEVTAEGYYEHAREDICDLVARFSPKSLPKVLDLGCASGRLGEALKARGTASLVHGIELSESAALEATSRLDQVWVGDLSLFDWTQADTDYDVIIAADVLEHLADPWETLRQLRRILSVGGRIIASVPNVRYWKVIADLLFRGEFRYVDAGILDRTHLRFFTKSSLGRLFAEAGYTVEYLAPKPIPRRGWRGTLMDIAGDFAHVQYHVAAQPSMAPS